MVTESKTMLAVRNRRIPIGRRFGNVGAAAGLIGSNVVTMGIKSLPLNQEPLFESPGGWLDQDGRLRGTFHPVPGRCGYRLWRTNPPRYCACYPIKGRERCRIHGGKAVTGIANPSWRNGVHSEFLPHGLRDDYDRLDGDAELESLRAQLKLLATRELELVRRLRDQEVPPWGRAVDALVDLEAAMRGDDKERASDALTALATIMREGTEKANNYEATWHLLQEIFQQKAKLTLAESKHLALLGGYVKLRDLVAVIVSILQVIRENVPDVKARQTIQNRVGQIMKNRARATARQLSTNGGNGG
jgi:hypothetical protein